MSLAGIRWWDSVEGTHKLEPDVGAIMAAAIVKEGDAQTPSSKGMGTTVQMSCWVARQSQYVCVGAFCCGSGVKGRLAGRAGDVGAMGRETGCILGMHVARRHTCAVKYVLVREAAGGASLLG